VIQIPSQILSCLTRADCPPQGLKLMNHCAAKMPSKQKRKIFRIVVHHSANGLPGSLCSPSRNLEKATAASVAHQPLRRPTGCRPPWCLKGHQDAALHHYRMALGHSMDSVWFCLHQQHHTHPYFNADMHED